MSDCQGFSRSRGGRDVRVAWKGAGHVKDPGGDRNGPQLACGEVLFLTVVLEILPLGEPG